MPHSTAPHRTAPRSLQTISPLCSSYCRLFCQVPNTTCMIGVRLFLAEKKRPTPREQAPHHLMCVCVCVSTAETHVGAPYIPCTRFLRSKNVNTEQYISYRTRSGHKQNTRRRSPPRRNKMCTYDTKHVGNALFCHTEKGQTV